MKSALLVIDMQNGFLSPRSPLFIAGAPENVRHVVCGGGHRFYAADAWPVFDEVTGWR